MKTIREIIMMHVPAPGNSGPTREELVNAVEWDTRRIQADGMVGPTRKSIRDKIKRMIRNCEITEWASGGITQIS